MKKIIIQGLITISLFFASWLFLVQIDWTSLLKVQKITDKTEEKLGDLFWEVYQKNTHENKNPLIVNAVDSLVTKICSANKIDRESVKIHILEEEDINAFAMPNGHLVVYTGLILQSENPEELSGVIAHEIAHIQLNHVMKKLVKEVGLSVLISMTTGNSGSDIIKETAKMLSSSAFDRGLEKEADIKAVDYLIMSKTDPEAFANFLYKIADTESDVTTYLTWVSTHPESKERAEYIIDYSKDKKVKYQSILSEETWAKIREKLTAE